MTTEKNTKEKVYIHTCPDNGNIYKFSFKLIDDLKKRRIPARCGYCKAEIR